MATINLNTQKSKVINDFCLESGEIMLPKIGTFREKI
jgi:hypothetical protein